MDSEYIVYEFVLGQVRNWVARILAYMQFLCPTIRHCII